MRLRTTLVATVILSSATLWAADYLTHGVDPGRTGWVKDEKVFTTANVGDMKLLWKLKLESTPRAMHNLFTPLIAEKVTTPQGTREIAVVAGVNDDLVRHRRRDRQADLAPAFRQHAAGARLAPVDNVSVLADRPPCRRSPMARRPAIHHLRRFVGRAAAAGQPRDGQDVAPPEKFMPGGGKPYALNLVNGVIYTATAQGCGGLTERVLLVRPRHPAGQHLHPGRRRPVGPPRRRDRSGGPRLSRHRRRAVRPGNQAASATASSA